MIKKYHHYSYPASERFSITSSGATEVSEHSYVSIVIGNKAVGKIAHSTYIVEHSSVCIEPESEFKVNEKKLMQLNDNTIVIPID